MEKLYRRLNSIGVCNLVIGIMTLIIGIAFGIVIIINGARTLRSKKELIF
jgi:hypothetical protein